MPARWALAAAFRCEGFQCLQATRTSPCIDTDLQGTQTLLCACVHIKKKNEVYFLPRPIISAAEHTEDRGVVPAPRYRRPY